MKTGVLVLCLLLAPLTGAWALALLSTAALWHHLVRRDATLVQMLPGGVGHSAERDRAPG